jgi:hypothetical protein
MTVHELEGDGAGWRGSSPARRRRKRTANTTSRVAIRMEKNALIPQRKK